MKEVILMELDKLKKKLEEAENKKLYYAINFLKLEISKIEKRDLKCN